jgi:hypothetical protein
MAMNVLNVWGEIVGIAVGAVILLVFAITFSPLVHRPRVPSGSAVETTDTGDKEAHEEHGEESGGEHVHADGYIDSFAGLIEEAGGSLPLLVTIFSIGLLIWWGVYLVTNWSQFLFSVRTLWR